MKDEGKLYLLPDKLHWRPNNLIDGWFAESAIGVIDVRHSDGRWFATIRGEWITSSYRASDEAKVAAFEYCRSRLASALVEATPAQIRAALEGKDEG